MAGFSTMVQDDYGIKQKPITKRNPQANAIVERVHKTIGNMIRTFEIQENQGIDESHPWSAIISTVHTTTKTASMQLVFGRDSMPNIPFTANWKFIEAGKRKLIERNNKRENSKRIAHTYQVGDQILIKQRQETKFSRHPYRGPFTVISAQGINVVVNEVRVQDTYNIRQIKPYIA